MERVQYVSKEVARLHQNAKDEGMRTWVFGNHVLIVEKYAKKIALEVGADVEICRLAALLHDIARTKGVMKDPALMRDSLDMTTAILTSTGYPDKKIRRVKEAIRFHSCKRTLPKTKEGKVLATADALAHLMTDFYLVFEKHPWCGVPEGKRAYRAWARKKLERDFRLKIVFGKYRTFAAKPYEKLKTRYLD